MCTLTHLHNVVYNNVNLYILRYGITKRDVRNVFPADVPPLFLCECSLRILSSLRHRWDPSLASGDFPPFLQQPKSLRTYARRHVHTSTLLRNRQMYPKDYYSVLGVSPQASQKQVKERFYALSKSLHPDVNKALDAHKKFSDISEVKLLSIIASRICGDFWQFRILNELPKINKFIKR